jgi:hypothetical protein
MPRNKGVGMNPKEAHLYDFIPTARDDHGVHDIRAEAYTRHPTSAIKTLQLKFTAGRRTTLCVHLP